MSIFGEALKKAGMATDEDVKRTQKEKVADAELADRMATATLWLEKLSTQDIRRVAKGDFERLEAWDRHALPWHCQEVAYEIARQFVHEGGRERRERDAAIVAARKARSAHAQLQELPAGLAERRAEATAGGTGEDDA